MPVRPIPKNHISVTGRHASSKSVGNADFESLLEADHLILLDFDHAVRLYEVQPIRIPVPAKNTDYVPDTLAHFHPDAHGTARRSELIEVKPSMLLKKHRADYAPKFEAARAYADEHGWIFVVKTEHDIRTPRLANLKFLRRYRSQEVADGDVERLTDRLADAGGRCSEAQLLGADLVGEEERMRLLPALWHMVVSGRLVVDLDNPISSDTVIAFPTTE